MKWFEIYPYLAAFLFTSAADVLLGTIRAFADKQINSDICGKGMRKKAAMIIIALVAMVLEKIIAVPLPVSEGIAAGFFLAELYSVIENAKLLGAPIPDRFTDYFSELITRQINVGNRTIYGQLGKQMKKTSDPVEEIMEHIE